MDGTQLDVVDDFKYLGSWAASTNHDIKAWRAQAWKVLHDMKKIWKSRLTPQLKRRVFVASVESVSSVVVRPGLLLYRWNAA